MARSTGCSTGAGVSIAGAASRRQRCSWAGDGGHGHLSEITKTPNSKWFQMFWQTKWFAGNDLWKLMKAKIHVDTTRRQNLNRRLDAGNGHKKHEKPHKNYRPSTTNSLHVGRRRRPRACVVIMASIWQAARSTAVSGKRLIMLNPSDHKKVDTGIAPSGAAMLIKSYKWLWTPSLLHALWLHCWGSTWQSEVGWENVSTTQSVQIADSFIARPCWWQSSLEFVMLLCPRPGL